MAIVTFWQLDQSARKMVAMPLAVLGSFILIVTFCAAASTAQGFDAQCRIQQ